MAAAEHDYIGIEDIDDVGEGAREAFFITLQRRFASDVVCGCARDNLLRFEMFADYVEMIAF